MFRLVGHICGRSNNHGWLFYGRNGYDFDQFELVDKSYLDNFRMDNVKITVVETGKHGFEIDK